MLQIDDLLESSPQQTAFTRGLKLLRVSSAAILLLIECLRGSMRNSTFRELGHVPLF